MIKINREATCRINPFTNPGRKGAAEAAGQRTLRNAGGQAETGGADEQSHPETSE